jgi:hypothetical protein
MTAGGVDVTKIPEIPIPCGERWSTITRGVSLPEHEIMRIKTYLSGMNSDDLVYTDWYGSIDRASKESSHVTRLVIVGEDGAGRRLRREDFDVRPDELLDDIASVYLCTIGEDGSELRYVLIDCNDSGDPILVCRRIDFRTVFVALRDGAGGGTGTVWMGSRVVDADEWLSLDESPYLFPDDLASLVHESAGGFLRSQDAEALIDWGVAPRRGVVLHGPPGNGKTVLSRIAAKRALLAGVNVVFLTVNVLSRGVGDHLKLAASRSPVLIVIDDLDVHCGQRLRDTDGHPGSAPRQRFLADLLEFLDGVSVNENYALLATTNALDDLDFALRRPGRLDLHIPVSGPSEGHRRALLERDLAVDGEAPSVAGAVAAMAGCSYADIAELVRRYKLAVVRTHRRPSVDQGLLDETIRQFTQEIGLRKVAESGPTFD